MAKRRLIDLTGAPFVCELREDGRWYIVGVKVRKREFLFESTGLPVDVVDRLSGKAGDGKINGIREIEDFLENVPEDSRLVDEISMDDIQEDLEGILGIPFDETDTGESLSV